VASPGESRRIGKIANKAPPQPPRSLFLTKNGLSCSLVRVGLLGLEDMGDLVLQIFEMSLRRRIPRSRGFGFDQAFECFQLRPDRAPAVVLHCRNGSRRGGRSRSETAAEELDVSPLQVAAIRVNFERITGRELGEDAGANVA